MKENSATDGLNTWNCMIIQNQICSRSINNHSVYVLGKEEV